MTDEHWIQLLIAILATVVPSTAYFFARFLVKQLMKKLASDVSAILKQVTPNGGNTNALGDEVLKIKRHLEKVDKRQDENTISVNDLQSKQNLQMTMLKSIMRYNNIPMPQPQESP